MTGASSSCCFKRRVVRSSRSHAMGSSQPLASSQVRSDSAMSNDMSISEPSLRSAIAIVICTRTVARLAEGSPLMSSEAVRARGSDATIRPFPLYSDLKGPSPIAILASNEPGQRAWSGSRPARS